MPREASRNTQRGVVFGSRNTSFSPRSSSVMPIPPVNSPPDRVVGMAIRASFDAGSLGAWSPVVGVKCNHSRSKSSRFGQHQRDAFAQIDHRAAAKTDESIGPGCACQACSSQHGRSRVCARDSVNSPTQRVPKTSRTAGSKAVRVRLDVETRKARWIPCCSMIQRDGLRRRNTPSARGFVADAMNLVKVTTKGAWRAAAKGSGCSI